MGELLRECVRGFGWREVEGGAGMLFGQFFSVSSRALALDLSLFFFVTASAFLFSPDRLLLFLFL